MLAAITQVLNQDSDTQVDVCMTSEMARRIELWTAMYEDNAPWVDRKKVKSAQLPAAIASEVARLVTLEMKSEITGGSSATCFKTTLCPSSAITGFKFMEEATR